MEEKELLEAYRKIESKIIPIRDFLESKKDINGYKGLYKGIITIQGPLVYKPEVLFIGINPGEGAYRELNQFSGKNITPLRMFDSYGKYGNQMDWYKAGNARGFFKIKNNWIDFEWFQRDQRINNPFIKNMIDFLYEIAKIKYPDQYNLEKYDHNMEPIWYRTFGKSVMCTNLYPIATTNISDLSKMLDSLAQEEVLQNLWEECKGNDKSINNWTVRKFFIRRADELIRLVKPKIIVCMGTTAFNDFTYLNERGKKTYYTEKKFGETKIPVIGFSRRGQWSGLIPDIAKQIVEKQIQE